MTGPLLDYALVVGGFAGATATLAWIARRLFGQGRPSSRRRSPSGRLPRRRLEEVAADLRRLARQTSQVAAGTPMARRRGLQAAYDDLLVEAASLLDIPTSLRAVPEGVARDSERLYLEAALAAAGLEVR